MKLSQLPVGSLVIDPNTKYNNDVIIWQVLEHGHTGDPAGSTALQTRDIITLKCFDAKEPNNADSNRKTNGNNRYKYSNILQWLNSDAASWYEAQHSADEAPSSSYVYAESGTPNNPYDTEAGFLSNFSSKFKNALLAVSKLTVLNTVTDGGGFESVSSNVFLPSTTEVGLANENSIAEGSIYSLYNTASNRIKNLANNAAKGDDTQATSPWYWILRTPDSTKSQYIRQVINDGSLYISICNRARFDGISPALCISSDTEVSDTPDASNRYTLKFSPQAVKVYVGDANNQAVTAWEKNTISALVPIMTSNTTPYGVVSADSETTGSGNYAWKAFDGSIEDGHSWRSTSTSGSWIQYQFTNPVCVKRLTCEMHSSLFQVGTFKLQGSNDGTIFIELSEFQYTENNVIQTKEVNNNDYYLYYRVLTVTPNRTNRFTEWGHLQFYGY